MNQNWLRCRFKANVDDYRPIKFPPPGPYWCSGETLDNAILVAYVRDLNQITEYWPEAEDIESVEQTEIVFTDRFPRPKWYKNT